MNVNNTCKILKVGLSSFFKEFNPVASCLCIHTYLHICVCAHSVVQPCPTLCNPVDSSSPASTVHGIFQARTLEQVPLPSPEDLPDPGVKPASLVPPSLTDRFFTIEPSGKPHPYTQLGTKKKKRQISNSTPLFKKPSVYKAPKLRL